jgi:hypothetical protein
MQWASSTARSGTFREERRRLEPLGRDVDEPDLPSAQSGLPLLPLALAERAVHERGGDAAGAQGVDLVLHQRDERRDHHRGARQEERGELKAETLTSPGGQDGDGGPAREHRPHDGFLPLAELLVPEMFAQRLLQIDLHLPSSLPRLPIE